MTALRGITWDHPRGYDPLVASAASWREQTGVDVQWEKRSLQAFADVPISGLAEDFDLMVIDHPHVGQVAADRSVVPLPFPSRMDGGTVGRSAESYVWNGECLAYAIDAACQMAVRRADSEAPIVRRWEDFLAPDASRFGAVTPLKPVDAFDMLLTLLASLDAQLPFSDEVFCERDAMKRSLAVLMALYRLGPRESVEWNPIHVLELLSAEESEFSCSPCLFGYINYARPGFRPTQLEYVDLPVFASAGKRAGILGGAGVAVSARSGERDAAVAYAEWLASDEVQGGLYLENNGQPASSLAWDRGALDPVYSEFMGGGRATIDSAWTRPRDEWFLGFVDDMCEIMPDFFRLAIPFDRFADNIDRLYAKHREACGR